MIEFENSDGMQMPLSDAELKTLAGVLERVFPEVVDNQRAGPKLQYLKLVGLVNEAMALLDKHTPCAEGCGHCCHMAVTVTEYEAVRIAAYTGVAPEPQPDLDLSRIEDIAEYQHNMVKRWIRVPCVFLDAGKGSCTIYPVRPIACRAYHTIAPTNEPCKLGMAGERGKEVPALNLNELHLAHAITTPPDQHYADIREWFPKGYGEVKK